MGGQVRSAEMQDGHVVKTPGTALRMATERENSGDSGTFDNPVNHAQPPARNEPGKPRPRSGAANTAEPRWHGPVSPRGRPRPDRELVSGAAVLKAAQEQPWEPQA